MAAPLFAPPADIDPTARKRVCKACDRCRLKKSKVSPDSAGRARRKLKIDRGSVMAPVPVTGVEPTTPSVCLENAKSHLTEPIPKGWSTGLTQMAAATLMQAA